MTRKRFIKLMMAHGYTRNQCERMANSITKTGYSYRETYNLAMGFHSMWPRIYPSIERAARAIAEFFHCLSAWVVRAAETFAKAISTAFSDLELPPKDKP